jgi:hypothetical protein
LVCLLEEPTQKPVAAGLADSIVRPLTITWKAYTPNFRKAVVAVPGDGFLRISEVYYPGWKVLIDKQPARIYRADLAWMAVNITKGEHTVEMMPHSLYLKKAEIVSYPLMVLMMIYWVTIGTMKFVRRKK